MKFKKSYLTQFIVHIFHFKISLTRSWEIEVRWGSGFVMKTAQCVTSWNIECIYEYWEQGEIGAWSCLNERLQLLLFARLEIILSKPSPHLNSCQISTPYRSTISQYITWRGKKRYLMEQLQCWMVMPWKVTCAGRNFILIKITNPIC